MMRQETDEVRKGGVCWSQLHNDKRTQWQYNRIARTERTIPLSL